MLISVNDILDKYSHIRLAKSEDSNELSILRKRCEFRTDGMVMHYERGNNYFDFICEQGEKSLVFVFENSDKSIGGVGTLVIRKMFIDGIVQNVGYLTEIFTLESLSRRTRIQWRQAYAEILEKMHMTYELHDCKFLYSAIIDNNKLSLNSFTQGKGGIIYSPIQKYHSINILGQIPGFRFFRSLKTSTDYTIVNATQDDLYSLRKFLHSQNYPKMLGHNFQIEGHDELMRRFETWKNFNLSSFILVKDQTNQIIACVAPHSFSKTRKLVIDKMSLQKRFLGQITPFISGKKILPQNELAILYLTHLEISEDLPVEIKDKILLDLLDFIFDQKINKKYNIISFFSFPQNKYEKILKKSGHVFEAISANIYSVYSEKRAENVLPYKYESPFACEMAIS